MIDDEQYSIILPGRIVEYFSATQTATIKICAEHVYSSSVKIGGVVERVNLEDVPVHTPSGGGWSMTMPINTGDTCLLFFSQVGYDHWLFKDKDSAGLVAGLPSPSRLRKFSEDDGFALVGLNTLPRAISNYSADGSQWRNSDATQNIHLRADLSIEVNSTTSITINAPSVVVNSETAEVNASSSATITTPELTVDSPISTFTGLISCIGMGVGAAPTAGVMSVQGPISATGEITSGSVGLTKHLHANPEGGNVGSAF